MLICYVSIKLLRQTCLFNTARFIFIYSSHFWHSHQTRENVSQTLLHTVSGKHVIQPRNRSKTLSTGVSLNVPQVDCHHSNQ